MTALRERLQDTLHKLPLLPRALGLVWQAAPGWTAAWLGLLVVQALLPVAQVLLTRLVVDSITLAFGAGLSWQNIRTPLLWVGLMALVLLFSQGMGSLLGWVRTMQGELVTDALSARLHRQSIRLDYTWYESPEFYDRLHRARSSGAGLPLQQVSALGSLVQSTLTLLSMAAVLLQYGWWVLLLLLLGTLPALWIVIRQGEKEYRWSRKATPEQRRVWYYDWLLTNRESAAELRLFGLGQTWQVAYQSVRAILRKQRLDLTRQQTLGQLAAGIIGLLTAGAGLAVMAGRGLLGRATLGDLALFYQAFNQGQSLARSLLQNTGQVYTNLLYLGDFFEFLDLVPQYPGSVVDVSTSPTRPLPGGTEPVALRMENITFAYPGSTEPAVQSFSIDLHPGRVTAIMGDNGAGKSTLIKLICRLHQPQSGRILWNGVDICEVDADALRSQITVLLQNPMQYQETVLTNIRYGNLDAGEDELKRAAQISGADDFINDLPQTYQTMLGRWFEKGTDLSAGQWQRLSLARALARPASLILLDEPTSVLDAWAEVDWFQRLHRARRGRTTLLITHRLTTACQADWIAVMAGGTVVEAGTHSDLLSKHGRYAQAWHAQQPERAA